jgi:hypothetical protein
MVRRRVPDRLGAACVAAGLTLAVAAALGAGADGTDRSAGPPAVGRPGCPAVLPGTSNALDDYADLVVWQGRSYLSSSQVPERPVAGSPLPDPIRLDREVTTVGCSLSDPATTGGERLAPGPWPDGTATALPVGAALRAVRGVDPSCVLGVEHRGEVVAYVAVDLDGDWRPLC